MSDLQARFDAAVANSKSLPERPDNTVLLKLYALYKQASEGDVEGRREVPELGSGQGDAERLGGLGAELDPLRKLFGLFGLLGPFVRGRPVGTGDREERNRGCQ